MPTMSTVDLSERDNKETLFVKEEVTNDAEVFGEVVVDVEGSQKAITMAGFGRRFKVKSSQVNTLHTNTK